MIHLRKKFLFSWKKIKCERFIEMEAQILHLFDTNITPLFVQIVQLPSGEAEFILSNMITTLGPVLKSLKDKVPVEQQKNIEVFFPIIDRIVGNASGNSVEILNNNDLPKLNMSGGKRRNQTRRSQKGGDCVTRRVRELKEQNDAWKNTQDMFNMAREDGDRNEMRNLTAIMYRMEEEFTAQARIYCNQPGLGGALVGAIAARETELVSGVLSTLITFGIAFLLPRAASNLTKGVIMLPFLILGQILNELILKCILAWNNSAGYFLPKMNEPKTDFTTLGDTIGRKIDEFFEAIGGSGGHEVRAFSAIILFITIFYFFYLTNIVLVKARQLKGGRVNPLYLELNFGGNPLRLANEVGAPAGAQRIADQHDNGVVGLLGRLAAQNPAVGQGQLLQAPAPEGRPNQAPAPEGRPNQAPAPEGRPNQPPIVQGGARKLKSRSRHTRRK